MSEPTNSLTCQLGCWGLAGAAGLVAAGVGAVTSGLGWNGAVFLGALIFIVLGVLFTWLFCRPLPAAGDEHMASVHHVARTDGTAAEDHTAAPKTDANAAGRQEPAARRQASDQPSGTEMPDGAPETLSAPRGGQADDLKEIKGIGPKLEGLLHSMGYYHFDQIAGWTDQHVAWVDENIEGFRGRVTRDEWVAQAKILAAGGETEFSKRVESGGVY